MGDRNVRLSDYNYYFVTKGDRLGVFNTITRMFTKIPEGIIEVKMSEGLVSAEFANEVSSLPQAFYTNGVVVGHGVDEHDYIRNAYFGKTLSFNPRHFALSVIPTLSCNFSCSYCYEAGSVRGRRKLDMDDSILDKVCSFIRSLSGIETFQANFYGGEPLIDTKRFMNFASRMLKACSDINAKCGLSIVTNGYNLDGNVLSFLGSTNAKTLIQITLDGTKEIHDQKRCLKGGAPTFDRVIANLISAIDCLGKDKLDLVVRVNLNKEEAGCFDELCNFLEAKGILDRASVNVASVFVEDMGVCKDLGKQNEFDSLAYELNASVSARKGQTLQKSIQFLGGGSDLCAQLMRNSMIVAPDGSLYKCYMDIVNPLRRIGHIDEIYKLRSDSIHVGIMSRSKLDVSMCRDCKALPLCITHCPRDTISMGICHQFSEILKREIESFLAIKENMEPASIVHLGFSTQGS